MIAKLLADVDAKFDPKFRELKEQLDSIEKKIDEMMGK